MAQFDLTALQPQQAYHLVTRVVAPRPIALVSSVDGQGRGNLAPFSYFMMGGSNPPSCIFCPVNTRDGGHKHTLDNVEQTGEYVINICTRDFVEQMNQSSYTYARGVDELAQVGLRALPSAVVRPPRVAQSPVQLECRLVQIIRHGSGALASNYVLGEIVVLHVLDELLDASGRPDDSRIRFVGRLGGEHYTEVTAESLFSIPRPSEP